MRRMLPLPILLLLAAQAAAHVTVEPATAQANASTRIAIRVPHGCGPQAMLRLTVTLPDGTIQARPMPKAGWRIRITRRPLENPVSDGHGGQITEGIAEITWEGGPLPSEHYDEFVIMLRTPDRAGETLYLPAVQHCDAGGTAAWTEIPAAGRRVSDYRFPAPTLRLAPARIREGAN